MEESTSPRGHSVLSTGVIRVPAAATEPSPKTTARVLTPTKSGEDSGASRLRLGSTGCVEDCGNDDGFLAFLGSEGAYTSAGGGGWSISTLPGEEGLRWSGVKTEKVFDEWASSGGGRQQARMADLLLRPSPLLGSAVNTGKGYGNLKLDPQTSMLEKGWTNSLGQPRSTALACSEKTGTDTVSMPSGLAETAAKKGKKKDVQLRARPITLAHLASTSPDSTTTAFATAPATRGAPTRAKKATPPPRATKVAPAAEPAAAASTAADAERIRTATASTTTGSSVKLENTEERHEEENDGKKAATSATPRKKTKKKAVGGVKNAHTKSDSDDDFDDLDLDGLVGSELTDKRRRNREHAKRSRLRKRVRLGGLEEMVLQLQRENVGLRRIVMRTIPDRAAAIIRTCAENNTNADIVAKQDVIQGMRPGMSLGTSASSWSARGSGSGNGVRSDRRVPSALKLMSNSHQVFKALTNSQANFILTNPNLPDCPIIFASQGFLELTGYEGADVIGKNCRFLQGRGTDPDALSIIRNNIAAGRDTSVCLLNYKKDGTPFWNQLSIGVLLDAHGQVANLVGVVYEVNPMPSSLFHRLLHRVPLPETLLNLDSCSDGEDENAVEGGSAVADTERSSRVDGRSARSSVTTAGKGCGTGRSTAAPPRVVDRLRRTRAAAAVSNAHAFSESDKNT